MAQIRDYRPEDAPALQDLLRQIWGQDTWTVQYYRFGASAPTAQGGFLRTLVADEGGTLVGFGSAWTNPFHPHALYVGINVHPRFGRRGLGTRLLMALAQRSPGRLPLQGSTWEHSESGMRFARRHGFTEVRRTWEPELPLGDPQEDLHADCESRCAALGYAIVPLADLQAASDGLRQLAPLLAEIYTATHGPNPPRTMDADGWTDLLRRDPPDPEASFIALRHGRPVAMSAAHPDPDAGLILSWRGVAAGHRAHERDLILALTRRQVLAAHRRGLPALKGEFDSTDPWAMIQMEAFPFRPAPCWVTFRRAP
ncbi:MAG: GNAT family N-acetyltransferase [Bacillota bacterium]